MRDHSIDVDASKPCIFEVPALIRRHSPESFTPNSFSVGPLHYKKEYLKAQKKAEKIKQHYLNNLLTRKPTPQTTIEDFKRSILEVEEKARQCYDVPFDHLSKDEFVDMLVLDGCFIIELLRNYDNYYADNNNIEKDDPVFSVCWVLQVLYHDLILLENQIPWFLLARLFDMTSPTISGSTTSLTDLALNFFADSFPQCEIPEIEEGTHTHILDLLRNALVSSTEEEKWSIDWQLIPTAMSLVESGITFKKGKSSNLLDIKFEQGALEIPSLLIEETTGAKFRNLISYEQCYPDCKAKITSYTILLNNLINTTKDINVLHKAGIVNNWLNPRDTLEFFNNIYTDTYVKEFYYNKICQEVNEYTKRFWPKARAAYVHNHFADPWAIVSQIVAGIVVILTFLQTLYTMMQS